MSPEAQAFFDKQSPRDRMAIIDSWGGADLGDEWYRNAKAAGSVAAAPAPAAPAAFTGQAPTEITATNRQTADMTPEQRAAWAAQNLNSFDAQSRQAGGGPGATSEQAQAQWLAWDKHYDSACPPNAPYRGRAGTCEESPDNCPSGTTLHGSKCVGWDQLPAELGGTGGAGGAGGQGAAGQAAGASYFGQDDPLQRHLTNLATSGANQFGGATSAGQFAGGGVFTQGQHGIPEAPVAAAPAPVVNQPAQAALQAFGGGATSAAAPATYSDPYEAWKQGGRQGPAPGSSTIALPATAQTTAPATAQVVAPPPAYTNTMGGAESAAARAQFQGWKANPAPAAPAPAPAPDAFGVQGGGSGSFEDLVNPRRQRKDARTGAAWF